jgi:DNA-binding MarR family transcriptional regulator
VPARPLTFDPIAEARRQWTARWGRRPAPAMAAATSIMRVQQILMAELNELLRPFDLTFPRYEALMLLYLSRRGSLPLGKIGDRLQVHPTSVTGLIDRLEQQGLVTRVPHEHDRRTTLAKILPAGRGVAEQATAALNENDFAMSAIPRADIETVTAILRDFRASAGDFVEDPARHGARRSGNAK